MRPDQFTRNATRPKRCRRCRNIIEFIYYEANRWVSGDPEWAHPMNPLCPECHAEAMSRPTTAEGARILRRSES